MKILSAKFIKSITNISQIPSENLPEIAFAGRSNVGKSSLINCLLNRKKLALTSSSPGKTRLINFFNVNNSIYFVDLPGYGFAKTSKDERKKWKILIEEYISKSPRLTGIIQIIDARIGPTDLDIEMISWLSYLNIPMLVVATKIDKLPKNKMRAISGEYLEKLNIFGISKIYLFSSITKNGKVEIWKAIGSLINNKVDN